MNTEDHPNIHPRVHPPIVALAFIALVFVLGFLLPLGFTAPGWLRATGLGVTAIAFLFGLAAISQFRRAQTTVNPHGSVTQIITTGIYRFTRNPIYLGLSLMVIGFPLTFGIFWGVVAAPFFILAMNTLVIEREEAYLEKKFGKPYAEYRSRVRRWV